jgi:hypothetical protein
MQVIVGPIVTRDGGFAFDSWTPAGGFSRGYSYRRVEDAHYARRIEIKSGAGQFLGRTVACSTIDEFTSALAKGVATEVAHSHP